MLITSWQLTAYKYTIRYVAWKDNKNRERNIKRPIDWFYQQTHSMNWPRSHNCIIRDFTSHYRNAHCERLWCAIFSGICHKMMTNLQCHLRQSKQSWLWNPYEQTIALSFYWQCAWRTIQCNEIHTKHSKSFDSLSFIGIWRPSCRCRAVRLCYYFCLMPKRYAPIRFRP